LFDAGEASDIELEDRVNRLKSDVNNSVLNKPSNSDINTINDRTAGPSNYRNESPTYDDVINTTSHEQEG
jgi:hypothetical protein